MARAAGNVYARQLQLTLAAQPPLVSAMPESLLTKPVSRDIEVTPPNQTPAVEKPKRTNYIFVDFENVQEFDLDLITGKPVKVFLIVGVHRKTLPVDLVEKMQKHHDRVQLIKSEGATQNALDLVLAYHVGQQAATDPHGYFHVLSKDKHYDPLIKHLRANQILASRDEVFAKIPALVDVVKLALAERVELVLGTFRKNHKSRPTRRKTLLSNINAVFRKELSATELQAIVEALVARGLIEFTPTEQVVYKL